MSGAAMRGTAALPGSETSSRTKGTRRNLGDLISPETALAITGRDGKPRRRIGGGDGGGKAAGRREGEQQRMPRTQCRIRRVTEAASLRIEGAWAAKAPNLDRVRPPVGARCGGAGVTRSPTATNAEHPS